MNILNFLKYLSSFLTGSNNLDRQHLDLSGWAVRIMATLWLHVEVVVSTAGFYGMPKGNG